jgi:glycosyltransferase involved in cell wall biosynthesis
MTSKSTARPDAPIAPVAEAAAASPPAATPAFERLTLVLPAFNEAQRIGPALDELFGYLATPVARAALPPRIRVLVVDDGSTDRTVHMVLDRPEAGVPEDAPTRLEILRVPHGGKGAAVRAGMLAGDGDVLVFADADMATPPDQLPLAAGSSPTGLTCVPASPPIAG